MNELSPLQSNLKDWLCEAVGLSDLYASVSAVAVDMAIVAAYRHPEWAQAYAMSILPDQYSENLAEQLVKGVPIESLL